ncbi:hypothetical protein OOZ35_07760 [Mesoflavibacter profundi]|uniref:DUF5673 domain-containing protein n=1 Tax=Mesoflavibacter profundi TaxID=2708110 RepID=A0ABT4S0S4_9FLAO|nr:hypothetical protein [Mesoflavibacter profundi]MDA0177381.1 hypothetical protein [Mesoflavibacter profundi]
MNYKSIFRAFFPIGIILFLVLKSELRTEGSFGGLVDFFKYVFFLILGITIFIYTIVKQGKKISKKTEVREAKIILTFLLLSTFIAISSFWFPKDFFEKEPEFIAMDTFGTELRLLKDGKYMLRTRDYEWTTIDRGIYKIKDSIILLDEEVKEKRWGKRTQKYMIKNKNLIPIYSSGIETDSTEFLTIKMKKN